MQKPSKLGLIDYVHTEDFRHQSCERCVPFYLHRESWWCFHKICLILNHVTTNVNKQEIDLNPINRFDRLKQDWRRAAESVSAGQGRGRIFAPHTYLYWNNILRHKVLKGLKSEGRKSDKMRRLPSSVPPASSVLTESEEKGCPS